MRSRSRSTRSEGAKSTAENLSQRGRFPRTLGAQIACQPAQHPCQLLVLLGRPAVEQPTEPLAAELDQAVEQLVTVAREREGPVRPPPEAALRQPPPRGREARRLDGDPPSQLRGRAGRPLVDPRERPGLERRQVDARLARE